MIYFIGMTFNLIMCSYWIGNLYYGGSIVFSILGILIGFVLAVISFLGFVGAGISDDDIL